MNTKQLEYFISVAETLNFTKAAEKCYISQTAMTQQIKSLEEQVGTPLFVRDKHHVSLTAAGKVYLNEARSILARSEDAIKLARTASEGISGSITIGFIHGYEQSSFYQTLRGFHEAYPNISIHLMRENMNALYQLLENGNCDITFNISPYMETYPKLHHHFLKKYPLYAIFPLDHPMVKRESVTFRDLSNEEFIITQPEGRPIPEAEEVLMCYDRGGFMPKIVGVEREVYTVLLMVSAAFGIAVLPEFSIRCYQNTQNLRQVPILKPDGEPETMDFEICWLSENQNPAIENWLDWIQIRETTE